MNIDPEARADLLNDIDRVMEAHPNAPISTVLAALTPKWSEPAIRSGFDDYLLEIATP